MIIDARANFFDLLRYLVTLGHAGGYQPLGLRVKIRLVFRRRHVSRDRNTARGARSLCLRHRSIHDDGMEAHSVPLDLPIAKPAPSCLITSTLAPCIVAHFHRKINPDYAEIIKDSRDILGTFSIPGKFIS